MPLEVASVRERLPGREIEWFASIPSTMTVAVELARRGAPHGTVVGADEQTAGIGRQGHSWLSEPEAGLYLSMILRLPLAVRALPAIMLALGLAAQEAIVETAGLAPDLRWPNDVLISGRKCAGILAQLDGDAVIAGIGINVGQSSFPLDLATPATSLRMEGADVTREDLLAALVLAIERCCNVLAEQGTGAILTMFVNSSSYARGRRLRVEQEGRTIEGVSQGLDESGFLILREDNGREITILTGGVRPA